MILSGRAEYKIDIDRFMSAFFHHETFYKECNSVKVVALSMGEFAFEIEGKFTEEDILNILRNQQDSHVMIQTLGEGKWDEREDRLERNFNKC